MVEKDYQLLIDAIKKLGWCIAVPEKDSEDNPVRGLIIGENNYVDEIMNKI